ncbi:MAG: diacylglycerol kinase family protein [Candidatus Sulfotelmatobacter sp.]
MRAAVILGPGCSSKHIKPFQQTAERCGVGWRIEASSAADRFTDNQSADKQDVIVLFGGDGTIHRHLSQLVKLGVPVLVVPVGSGNDFAHALGFRGVGDALAGWRRFCAGDGNVRSIDLGVITPVQPSSASPQSEASPATEFISADYFCSVAGVGLDCKVARRANALPQWLRGHGGYALSLIPMIFRFAPLPIKILTPNENGWAVRSDQPTILAAFANTSTYGGGMKIAPHAKMEDGQLDVCVIAGIHPFKLFCMFPTVYFGRHLKIRKVEYFRATCIRIETELPLDVYADGEYVCRTPVEVGVQAAALKVLVP